MKSSSSNVSISIPILSWIKVPLDHFSAAAACHLDREFNSLIRRTARARGPIEVSGLEELVFEGVVLRDENGLIPVCVAETIGYISSCSDGGKKSAESRKSHKSLISATTSEPRREQLSTTFQPKEMKGNEMKGNEMKEELLSPTAPAKAVRKKKEVDPMIEPPDRIDRETWKAFYEMRIKHRCGPMTTHAQNLMIKKLMTFRDPKASLENSIIGSYSDCKEWVSYNQQPRQFDTGRKTDDYGTGSGEF